MHQDIFLENAPILRIGSIRLEKVESLQTFSFLSTQKLVLQFGARSFRQLDILSNAKNFFRWQNDKFTKWQVDKMTSWQNDKLTKWQADKTASWLNGKVAMRKVDE